MLMMFLSCVPRSFCLWTVFIPLTSIEKIIRSVSSRPNRNFFLLLFYLHSFDQHFYNNAQDKIVRWKFDIFTTDEFFVLVVVFIISQLGCVLSRLIEIYSQPECLVLIKKSCTSENEIISGRIILRKFVSLEGLKHIFSSAQKILAINLEVFSLEGRRVRARTRAHLRENRFYCWFFSCIL